MEFCASPELGSGSALRDPHATLRHNKVPADEEALGSHTELKLVQSPAVESIQIEFELGEI